MGVIVYHERTVGERVRTDGSEQNGLDRGDEHGTSGGQGIGGGTGGGGEDDAVSLVLDHQLVIDAQLKADEAGDGALDVDGIVERIIMGDLMAAAVRTALKPVRDSDGHWPAMVAVSAG